MVLLENGAVGSSIDWIIRLFAAVPGFAIFADDDSLAGFGSIGSIPESGIGGALRVEVFELVDASIFRVEVGVVHDWTALEVINVEMFFFEIETAPSQLAELIIIIAIDGASIDNENIGGAESLNVRISEEIGLKANFEIIAAGSDKVFEPGVITGGGEAFVSIVKIAVIIIITNGETLDNVRRKIFGGSLPLFSGVVFDKGLEERLADERNSLLGEILRLGRSSGGLASDLYLSLIGRIGGMEELVNGAEINWQRINFAGVCSINFMNIIREFRKAISIIPDALVGSMEEMGAVFMAFDAGFGVEFGIAVAAEMRAFVDQEDFFVTFVRDALSHSKAKEAGANDENVVTRITIITTHKIFLPFSSINFRRPWQRRRVCLRQRLDLFR